MCCCYGNDLLWVGCSESVEVADSVDSKGLEPLGYAESRKPSFGVVAGIGVEARACSEAVGGWTDWIE